MTVAIVRDPAIHTDPSPTLRRRRGAECPEAPPGEPRVLEGNAEWVVEGTEAQLEAITRELPRAMCEPLTTRVLLLHFRNTVGRLDLPGIGPIEVRYNKWTQADFEHMLADLTEIATALPFAAAETATLPYDRSAAARDDVVYHAFVYLRHVLSDRAPSERRLDTALEVILRDPHRSWERITHHVPPGRARHIEPAALVEMILSPMVRLPAGATVASPLAARLRGHIPLQVAERRVRHSVDTPENRFIKAFIGQALAIVHRVRSEATRRAAPAVSGRIADDAERIERRLRPSARAALWTEVGAMTHLPLASTVLHRRRGYRNVFEHFSRLRMATRIPLDAKQLLDVIEAKDIAKLYELWCYFAVVRGLKEILGRPSRTSRVLHGPFQARVHHEFRVEWPGGVRAIYNPHFSTSNRRRRSYSLPMRPDIAVEVPMHDGPVFHLFDAKFRVDRPPKRATVERSNDSSAPFADEAAARTLNSPDATVSGRAKRVDLYKMHAYRDAVVRARSAWVLFPGARYEAFVVGPSGGDPTNGPVALAGVGAIPARPGQTRLQDLIDVLTRVVN